MDAVIITRRIHRSISAYQVFIFNIRTFTIATAGIRGWDDFAKEVREVGWRWWGIVQEVSERR